VTGMSTAAGVPGTAVTALATVVGVAPSRGSDESRRFVAWLAAREHVLLLALIGVVYVAIYGGLLFWSNGLPFITDNNESFSTLWHARNMAEYGAGASYLLTDEVFSPHAEAHPFVHTHQGNFPRLFAFLLYMLGARSVEAQIALTTFTIGALTVFLAYHLFSQIVGPRFACVVALVLMTDYLFFAQWQVVTYRVWHACFMFAGLVCARGAARTARPGRWLVLTSLCWAGLFYYELVFAAFVSIFSALYAAWLMRRSIRRLLGFGSAQALGGTIALTILVVQLASYLGWDGLREDVSITYLARNFAANAGQDTFSSASMHAYFEFIGRLTATDPSFQARLERFYGEHNVIFWWNLVDSRPLRDSDYFVGSVFVWVFQMYTPLLVLLVGIVLGGWVLGVALDLLTPGHLFPRRPPGQAGFAIELQQPVLRGRLMLDLRMDRPTEVAPDLQDAVAWAMRIVRLGPFALALLFLLITLFRDQAYLGALPSSASFARATGGRAILMVFLGSAVGCLVLMRLVTGRWLAAGSLPLVPSWLAALLLWGIATAIRRQAAFYDQAYAPIWLGQIEATIPSLFTRGAVLAAIGLALGLIFVGDRRVTGSDSAARLRRVIPYLVCGALAYSLVYYLAAGYVLTGYLVRYGPLLVFLTDVMLALAIMLAVLAALRLLGRVAEAWRESRAWLDRASVREPRWSDHPGQTAFIGRGATALTGMLVSGALFIFLAGYWLHVQTYYVRELPPTHFAFLKLLREPPFAGATFVVSTYSAPVAWQVQEWAYFDPQFGQDEVTVVNDEVRIKRDLKTYVWLADRATNPAYQHPAYFVCSTPNHLRGVLERLTHPGNPGGRCSDLPIVRRALAGGRPYLNHQVVARDLSELDSWAILKLDWSVPPGSRLAADASGGRADLPPDEQVASRRPGGGPVPATDIVGPR
jgi:hypothetical protein